MMTAALMQIEFFNIRYAASQHFSEAYGRWQGPFIFILLVVLKLKRKICQLSQEDFLSSLHFGDSFFPL